MGLLNKIINKLKTMIDKKISSSPLPADVAKINEVNVANSPSRIEVIPNDGEVVPNKDKEMDFPSAIKEVIGGKKITRVEWGDKNIYGFLNETVLSIHMLDGNNHKWIVSEGDLISEDWIILDK